MGIVRYLYNNIRFSGKYSMSKIKAGHHVMFVCTKNNDFKCIKVPRNQQLFIKPLKFDPDSVIGQPFGQKYQVNRGKLTVCEKEKVFQEPDVNCDKTNKFIRDENTSQILTQGEIEEMKADGVSGKEIVEKLVENSTAFEAKTEFAKAKWLKKKIVKYNPSIVTKKPSMRNFCQAATSKIRLDTMGQIMNAANVWNSSKVIVVETKDDLITSGVAQRLAGDGEVVQVYEQRTPHSMYTKWLDLGNSNSVIHYFPCKNICDLSHMKDQKEINELKDGDEEEDEEKPQLGKRKREEEMLEEKILKAQEKLETKSFDSLIVSTFYNPLPVVEGLWDCVRPSGKLVLHTEHLNAAIEVANFAESHGCAEMSLTDSWFREIQVLPGRTHPDMRMQSGGGYLLTCTKVLPDIIEQGSKREMAYKDNGSTSVELPEEKMG